MHYQNLHITRNHLLHHLSSIPKDNLIYFHAPAGYGKTTSIHQWIQKSNNNYCVLSLDTFDNKPPHFYHHFGRALLKAQPDNALLKNIVLHPSFMDDPEDFIIKAIHTLLLNKPCQFIIDDLHHVKNERILRLTIHLINRLPETFQVSLLSRDELPPLFRPLLLKGKISVITPEQFRFTEQEIYHLYKKNTYQITLKSAKEICAATNGWPIAVNALMLAGNTSRKHNFTSDNLESFIQLEIWDKWSRELRDFMVWTAVIPNLTPDICIALTGNPQSASILDNLTAQNAFLSKTQDGTYRFHQLFRTFLEKELKNLGQVFLYQQYKKAGEWYIKQHDFYNGIFYFYQCENAEGIAQCFDLLETLDRNEFIIEDIFSIVKELQIDTTADKYPFLYYMAAWEAYNNGRANEATSYMDKYYQNHPRIVQRNPELAHNIFFMNAWDFRVKLHDIVQNLLSLPVLPDLKPVVGSTTLNLPLFHRSFRDFSEYSTVSMLSEIKILKETIKDLIGQEIDMLVYCLISGLYYEQGNLPEALKYILLSHGQMQENFTPESIFCVLAMQFHILESMDEHSKIPGVIKEIERLIDSRSCYYLNRNFSSLKMRLSIRKKEYHLMTSWLKKYEYNPQERVCLYRIYEYFTTARIYIALKEYDLANILLDKLLQLSISYKRPLDIIESRVLLSIVCWERKTPASQSEALLLLQDALHMAREYNYIQVFINESSNLLTMLHKILNRKKVTGNEAPESSQHLRNLYFLLTEKHDKLPEALTSMAGTDIIFTPKQKTVMRLLCDGYSFQQIADKMGIKHSTVRSHIELIYRKLDVPNMSEAVKKIINLKLNY